MLFDAYHLMFLPPMLYQPTWNGFVVTIILVTFFVFSTLFYVGWKKYKGEQEDKRSKDIDSSDEFD